MTIFQKSVINKHLTNLNKEQVETAYLKFKENYSAAKIEKIKQLKEEEYQDGFLRDVFVDVFGYTLKPDNNHNLVREFKNQDDGRKADGAIIRNDGVNPIAIAVIELKSTKTKDLKSITDQAFNYKNNQPNCKYVITSNFQKLRFYIDYANEFEEFDLFQIANGSTDGLTRQFKFLYLILNKNSFFSDIPLKLKEETKFHEQEVSDKLYKDYSNFKRKLFDNLTKNHTDSNKLTLFKKSQKLLDRFLFILFAEDSGLLPPNSISRIIKRYEILKNEDAYKPIYDIFKQYFGYMNIGRKGQTDADNIPAYNGGLFYPDELLDKLKIDDEILIDELLNLSEYDFNTEVDVNILGHIFEHSLSEIEEITAEIEADKTDGLTRQQKTEKTSKRKKDGVFYTPKYITQYIVENTIGKLCNEKRKDLEIEEIEFDGTYRTKDGNLSAKGKKLYQKLKDYKDWLLSLKIVDPACGSGAFLNQTLNFLIQEHKNIDDIIAELTNTALRLFDIDKTILENNLYGVDINEESIEIAKLSLWLRTAQKGRKLSVLSNNIKCGNSLIDDPEVAGEKAFDWNKEFPQVFKEKEKKAWHITFVLLNSRYSLIDGLTRQLEPGFIAPTYPKLDTEQEIILAEELSKSVKEYDFNILGCNICADHVHAIIVCEEDELQTLVGKWKGRTAYTYNRRVNPSVDDQIAMYSDGTKEKFWAKSFHPVLIKDNQQLENTIDYIRNNREKHEIPQATNELTRWLNEITCTPNHAFRTEYNGSFDVVIGNPPYLRVQGLKANYEKESFFYEKTYISATGRFDIYALFMEKSFELIKTKGLVSFILPHKFLVSDFGEGIRKFFVENKAVESILHFGSEMVFTDASTYTCIINLSQNNSDVKFKQVNPNAIFNHFEFDVTNYAFLSAGKWNLKSENIENIFARLKSQPYTVKDKFKGIFQGIVSGDNKAFYLTNCIIRGDLIEGYNHAIEKRIVIEKEVCKKVANGKNIKRYEYDDTNTYIIYPYSCENESTEIIKESILLEKLPHCHSFFTQIEERLKARGSKNMKYPCWYSLWNFRNITNQESSKILTPDVCFKSSMFFDEKGELYYNDTSYALILKSDNENSYRYYLGILNSALCWFYLKNTSSELRGGYFRFKTKYLEPFPLPKIGDNANDIIEKVNKQLSCNKDFKNISERFLKYFQSQFQLEAVSKKLQNWYELEFSEFIKEINAAIKKAGGEKLTKSNEMDWMEVFETKKAEAQTLKSEIEKTDKEIDQMVYELYGLNEEEIEIVEGVLI